MTQLRPRLSRCWIAPLILCLGLQLQQGSFGQEQPAKPADGVSTQEKDAAADPPEKTNAPGESDSPEEPEPAKDSEPTKDSEPSGGFLGDTSRFTRLGGWGSIGAAAGQWGLAKSMLVMLPPVQEELEITEEQKTQLREWSDQMRTRGEEWGRSMREQQGEDEPLTQPDLPLSARIERFSGFMSQVNVLLRENEVGIDSILKESQRKRLTQIALQAEGVNALSRPEVMRAINLSPSQQLRVQQVLGQSRAMQTTTWMARMVAMAAARRNQGQVPAGAGESPQFRSQTRPRPPAGKSTSPATGLEKDSSANREEVDPETARAERAKAMQKQFEDTRGRTDRIQEQAVKEVLKVLTPRQRSSFEKLLGEPFDPAKINSLDRSRRGAEAPKGPPADEDSEDKS